MQIQVIRKVFNPTCTLGEMHIDGDFFAHTLEDVYRGQLENPADKVQNETAIPSGNYNVVVDHSAHFNKDLPHILNVHCFEGVRIHGGNTDRDTEGCILIGAETNGVDEIHNCAIKVAELTELICAAGTATLEVINEMAIS